MDLSGLSTADLQAIQKGDMSSVSTAGLKVIAGNRAPMSPVDSSQYANTLQIWNPLSSVFPGRYSNFDTHIPIGGDTQNFLAGAGKATADLARGAGQLVGAVSRKDVADSRALDAPLMATTAGKLGSLTGNVVDMAGAALIPGANTMAGASAIGAGLGLLQPSTSTGETVANTGLGAVLGPAGLLAGRGLGALYQGGKAALEPLFAGGQQRIAGRTLQAFAGTPQEAATAASNLTNAPSVLPGVHPTTAELANNAGISQLARVLKNNGEYATTLENRDAANRAAMTSAIGNIAGTPAQMDAAQAAREATASHLYGDARSQGANASAVAALNARLAQEGSRSMTDSIAPLQADLAAAKFNPFGGVGANKDMSAANSIAQQIAQAKSAASSMAADSNITGKGFIGGVDVSDLLRRPALQDAISGASRTAADFGQNIDSANPVSVLHYAKMGLDGQIGEAVRAGNNTKAASLMSAKNALLGRLEEISPTYKQASQTYADMSRPINQMQIGQQLSDKLVPALGDFGGNTPLRASQYATALRNGDQLAASATGRQDATLANTLSPDQLQTLNQVGEQLARTANANATNVIGSNTGQNLVGQNLLRQMLGPLGLPQSMGERVAQSTLGQQITRPLKFIAGYGEDNIRNQLASAMLDPQVASGLLNMQSNPTVGAILARQGLLGTTSAGLGDSLMYPSRQAAAPRLMDAVSPGQSKPSPSLEQQMRRARGF